MPRALCTWGHRGGRWSSPPPAGLGQGWDCHLPLSDPATSPVGNCIFQIVQKGPNFLFYPVTPR